MKRVYRDWPREPFTPRENAVAACLLDGMSNKEIGKAVGISFRSVEPVICNMRQKWHVATTRALIVDLAITRFG